MNNLIIICLLSLSIPITLYGQSGISNSQSSSQINKDFKFNRESSNQQVTFEVGPDCEEFRFKCNGEISEGHLNIKIYDPNGKKEGGFTLEAVKKSKGTNSNSNSNSDDNSSSYVFVFSGNGKSRGNMHKNIQAPIAGTWVVKIQADEVTGEAEINLKQSDHR